jgi:hypothetical protein
MGFIKQFISEQISADSVFEELYKKAKWEEKMALDLIKLRKEAKLFGQKMKYKAKCNI